MVMPLSVRACVLLLGLSAAIVVGAQSVLNETAHLVQQVKPVLWQRNGPRVTVPYQLRLAYAAVVSVSGESVSDKACATVSAGGVSIHVVHVTMCFSHTPSLGQLL